MNQKTIAGPLLLLLAALLCAASASAQMYKWTDAKGVIHFSDTPPASSLQKAEVKTYGAGEQPGPALPYELAQAARANPVRLYTTAACRPCDQARSFLQKRGIPYAEKSVSSADDQQALKAAGSDGQLPLLLVGRSKLVGFNPNQWNDALDAAYPSQSMLPRGYQFAAATPAAPPKAAQQDAARAAAAERAARAAAQQADQQAKFAPRPPPKNGTPDFQF
jgi:glutaredoxin